jgi:hypothetical protein
MRWKQEAAASVNAAEPSPVQIGQPSSQLSASEQTVIFQQFLRWKEQQTAANVSAAEPYR